MKLAKLIAHQYGTYSQVKTRQDLTNDGSKQKGRTHP